MRRLVLTVFLGICACASAFGQAGTEKQPMEITASGETKYENGLATAHGNVAMHTGDADIYADSVRYNPKTHEVVAEGHVRIYRTVGTFAGERAIYNTETKEIQAVNIKTDKDPYLVAGTQVKTISEQLPTAAGPDVIRPRSADAAGCEPAPSANNVNAAAMALKPNRLPIFAPLKLVPLKAKKKN